MTEPSSPDGVPAGRHGALDYDGRVKARSALVYTVLRLLAFLVPFGLLMLLPIMREYYWLAAIFAALIGLSLSMIFLRRPLDEMTTGLAERRDRVRAERAVKDEDVEDAATGASESRSAD